MLNTKLLSEINLFATEINFRMLRMSRTKNITYS